MEKRTRCFLTLLLSLFESWFSSNFKIFYELCREQKNLKYKETWQGTLVQKPRSPGCLESLF